MFELGKLLMSRRRCDECGANRGVQDSSWGSYCHACGHTQHIRSFAEQSEISRQHSDFDFSWSDYRGKEIELYFLRKGFTSEILDKFHVGSCSRDRYVIPYYSNGELEWVYAKYIDPDKKPRHYRVGKRDPQKPWTPYIYKHSSCPTITLVEDLESLMKVSQVSTVCALMGTKSHKLTLRDYLGGDFTTPIKIWLDSDVAGYNGARKLAQQLSWDYNDIEIIQTQKDPKEYNTSELYEILQCKPS